MKTTKFFQVNDFCTNTLKIFIGIFVLAALFNSASAQVGIGVNPPHASAQLEVASSNKGVLIPSMTETDRNNIQSPADGLLIYQTNNTKGFYYYNGSAWTPVATPPSPSPSIIPFSSGAPLMLTTVLGGLLNSGAAMGFGNSVSGLSQIGGIIDATSINNFAFSVPRDGTITSLSASFSNTIALTLIGSTLNVTAQLYQAYSSSSNIFTAVPGAIVTLAPSYTGIVSIGTVANGSTSGLSIPVTAGTRLMMVVRSDITAGLDVATSMSGYASAGLSIQ